MVSEKLQEMTNRFIAEFIEQYNREEKSTKNQALTAFNYILPEAIVASDYPKYEDAAGLLVPMSSFEDTIIKGMLNNNVQGFVKDIEKRISYTGEQEDYLVENLKTETFEKEERDFDWDGFAEDGGLENFKMIKYKVQAEKTTFDVINTRSGFEGKVTINRKPTKIFTNENDYTEETLPYEVLFYGRTGDLVMTIDFDENRKERANIMHYKYIADINSFYLILSYA